MNVAMHQAALCPRDGDVVVTRGVHSPVRFTVRQVPSVAQIQAATRDRALELARGFARDAAVNVWYSDHATYTLLDAYRR